MSPRITAMSSSSSRSKNDFGRTMADPPVFFFLRARPGANVEPRRWLASVDQVVRLGRGLDVLGAHVTLELGPDRLHGLDPLGALFGRQRADNAAGIDDGLLGRRID